MTGAEGQEKFWAAMEGYLRRSGSPAAGGGGLHAAVQCLDTADLQRLEVQFRSWAAAPRRDDLRPSRLRILIIFLLIRHTGARLGEALSLAPGRDLDPAAPAVQLGGRRHEAGAGRSVPLPGPLAGELARLWNDLRRCLACGGVMQVDPGHVRRKFYEQAEACGFARALGSPSAIRRARAVELLRANVPLPVVQKMLGHSTANLTAAFIDVPPEVMRRIVGHHVERESRRRTSARNVFFGRISRIETGDIQSLVVLTTLGGYPIFTVVTNESVARLELAVGGYATAEVKAPWVILRRDADSARTSADNRLDGTVDGLRQGRAASEVTVRLNDGVEICAVMTEASRRGLALGVGDPVAVLFNAFAVILNVD